LNWDCFYFGIPFIHLSTYVDFFIPREEGKGMKVEIVVAYTLLEVRQRLGRGEFDVRGTFMIIDVMTNDVKGTRASPRTSPVEIAGRVGTVTDLLMEKGCEVVIICEMKLMHFMDVTPYSNALHLKSL
jgi:hypothetical protein